MSSWMQCPECEGLGLDYYASETSVAYGGGPQDCTSCRGSGVVPQRDARGRFAATPTEEEQAKAMREAEDAAIQAGAVKGEQ